MYKRFLFLVFILSSFYTTQAQDTGISFEVQYPIMFSNEDYQYHENNGVLGGSLQYQITDNIPFNFGIEYKFDFFQSHEGYHNTSEIRKVGFLFNNINLYSKMLFISAPELQLYTTAGFTTYKYRNGLSRNFIGFNAGGGLTYDIYDTIYLSSSFSYMKATRKNLSQDYKENEKFTLLRVGLGFKF